MIFKELPDKTTRDLIREPLPAEWTDDPIMPPKYDKETITSRYINPTNVDDFALNVRETKAWQVMQYHPAFLPPTEIRIEKLWEYEKALNPGPVYNKQSRHNIIAGGGSRQRGKSWDLRTREERQARYSRHRGQSHSSDDQLGYFRLGLTNRIWDQPSCRDDDEPAGENEVLDRKSKISSPEPGEVCESDDQGPTTTKSPSPPPEREYHHIRQKYRHRSMDTSQDSRGRLLEVVFERDRRRSSPQALITPSLPLSHISRSPSRPLSTRSSQGGPSKPSSRRNSRSSLSPSSSRRGSIGSAGSPLTPNERELLGMRPYSSDSDTGPDSPIPQSNGTPARSRQRPAKLHAAYQRRW
ncbi:hypothetical protein ANO14919_038240 [Xylariales sp. No.14919]|nr:hypothetical protein ANO14919_038240 [Xylariales sp. No.14919]